MRMDLVYIVLMIVFTILIILTNGILLTVILSSELLRYSSKHLLMASLALGDILFGMYIGPVLIDVSIWNRPMICHAQLALEVTYSIIIPFVTTMAVAVMNMDYIMTIGCYCYINGRLQNVMRTILLLLPWILCLGVLIPLFLLSLDSLWTCSFLFDINRLLHLFLALSFFPAAFLVIVSALAAVFTYRFKWRSMMRVSEMRPLYTSLVPPTDVCIASFMTILLYTPIAVMLVFGNNIRCPTLEHSCDAFCWIQMAAQILFMLKSFCLPCIWIKCVNVRKAAIRLVSC